jgi:hypothetical protein
MTPQQLQEQAARRIKRGHVEWRENRLLFKRLIDAYLGGSAYRDADYGPDAWGFPTRNLMRHKRERPDPRTRGTAGLTDLATGDRVAIGGFSNDGREAALLTDPLSASGVRGSRPDPLAAAGVDDYETRRARTPVPQVVADIVGEHLDRIYSHAIRREQTSQALKDFLADVDGRGTDIDTFMTEEVAGPYLAAGVIDLQFDLPPVPEGQGRPATLAEQEARGLRSCRVIAIYPENVRWWRLRPDGRYAEVIVQEWHEVDDGTDVKARYRYWDDRRSILYREDGTILGQQDHDYGEVPIRRVMFRRRSGTTNVGQSPYEGMAERQREIYNSESEVVLSNTLHAHPFLTMAEKYCRPGADVPATIGFVVPTFVAEEGNTVVPPKFVEPPMGPTESLMKAIAHHTAEAYRQAGLMPPSWATSLTGIAREYDLMKLNTHLSRVSNALQRLEEAILDGWALVTQQPRGNAKIYYPGRFGAHDADKLIALLQGLGKVYETTGRLPESDKAFLKLLIREIEPGRQEAEYIDRDAEIDTFVDLLHERWTAAQQNQALGVPGMQPAPKDATGNGVPQDPRAVLESGGQPEQFNPVSVNRRLNRQGA